MRLEKERVQAEMDELRGAVGALEERNEKDRAAAKAKLAEELAKLGASWQAKSLQMVEDALAKANAAHQARHRLRALVPASSQD